MDCILQIFPGKLEFHFHNGLNVFRVTLRSNCKTNDYVMYFYLDKGK